MDTLKVSIKNVYGRDTIYPKNETAEIFCRIAGTRTLTRETLVLAGKLGFGLEVLAPTVVL
jgi:hypothetical protein